jgi:hypothetical protein
VLLAPSSRPIPNCFQNVRSDFGLFHDLMGKVQSLRASVYLRDGAIHQEDLVNGRHRQALDYGSWHVLLMDGQDQVCGCARYRQYSNNTQFSQLNVTRSALASCSQWGAALESSVNTELAFSRMLGLPFVELGGWALLDHVRGTTEAIRMALSTYGLAQLTGGGVGISTATYRNGSASILRRLGGQPLEHESHTLPAYHDPQYGCQMEILRFYSWTPNPRYGTWIDELKDALLDVQVVSDNHQAAFPARTAQVPALQFRRESAVIHVS